MSRDMLAYSLRRIPGVWSANPRLAIQALLLLVLAMSTGWGLNHLDATLTHPRTRLLLSTIGTCLCMTAAAIVSRHARFPVSADLLLGLILGGHGPQSPPPPFDPALGPRFPVSPIPAPERTPAIIIFVIDSARAGNMSIYGYERDTTPYLASLVARGAQSVPLAVSSGASSESGLWSILSSRRVRHHAINAPCLHHVLKATGYETWMLLSGMHWHTMGLECLFGNGLYVFEDQMNDEQLVQRVHRVPIRNPEGPPSFFFFHLMSVHSSADAPVQEIWTPSRHRFSQSEGGTLPPDARQPFVNHYDNAMRQADGCLGQILAALGNKGYLDDALVVVTADHGEHILERTPALIGHGRSLYQESIHIPFLLWDTRKPLPQPATLADQTDIAPTLLDLIGIEPPEPWQGRSVFANNARTSTHIEHISGRADQPLVHMEALLSQLPEGLFKTLRYRRDNQEILRQTFRLSDDPGETTDLEANLSPDIKTALNQALTNYREQPSLVAQTIWHHLAPEA